VPLTYGNEYPSLYSFYGSPSHRSFIDHLFSISSWMSCKRYKSWKWKALPLCTLLITYYFLNASDDGVQHSGLLGFSTLSIIWYSNEHKRRQHSRNWISFCPQGEGWKTPAFWLHFILHATFLHFVCCLVFQTEHNVSETLSLLSTGEIMGRHLMSWVC
jgi:hypothetical protein